MARRYYRKLAALAKIEAVYGTDNTPTGALNAMLMTDVTVTPMQGERVSRNLLLPYFGDQGFVLAGLYSRLEGSIEIAGAGTAGDAPAYGPLLRACGLAEILTAGTKAEYKPVSTGHESAALYVNLDGVNHVMVGARGTVTASLAPKQIPKFKFVLSGLLGPIVDTALPACDLTKFQRPLVCSKSNTTLTLHGLATVMESLDVNLGNQVEPRLLVGSESIEITSRAVSGTSVIEAVALATKDWFAITKAATTGAMLSKHGTVAGNIVEIEAPAVQIGEPAYGNTQGILNTSLPLAMTPVTGDDEIVIRVR